MMMFDHILIDADLIVYSVGHGSQEISYELEMDGEKRDFKSKRMLKEFIITAKKAYPYAEIRVHENITAVPESHALHSTKMKIQAITNQCNEFANQSFKPRLFLTSNDGSNFRYHICNKSKYKGHRGKKPVHYNIIRDYLIERHSSFVVFGREADDEIADIARSSKSIISSYDKDFLTVEGYHHDPRKGTFTFIPKEVAIRNFYIQMLVGDAADNVKGIYGLGQHRAEKLLPQKMNEQELFKKVFEIYQEQSDEDHFWENVDLLWIGHSIEKRKSDELRAKFT